MNVPTLAEGVACAHRTGVRHWPGPRLVRLGPESPGHPPSTGLGPRRRAGPISPARVIARRLAPESGTGAAGVLGPEQPRDRGVPDVIRYPVSPVELHVAHVQALRAKVRLDDSTHRSTGRTASPVPCEAKASGRPTVSGAATDPGEEDRRWRRHRARSRRGSRPTSVGVRMARGRGRRSSRRSAGGARGRIDRWRGPLGAPPPAARDDPPDNRPGPPGARCRPRAPAPECQAAEREPAPTGARGAAAGIDRAGPRVAPPRGPVDGTRHAQAAPGPGSVGRGRREEAGSIRWDPQPEQAPPPAPMLSNR
jgi:hypothetical protein